MINTTGFEDKKAIELYEGDLGVFNLPDGGEIACVDGQPFLDGGFDTAAYISLFGGDKSWWANLLIDDPNYRMGGELENLIRSIPLIPAYLIDIENAAKSDLTWFINMGLAKAISVDAGINGVNSLSTHIMITLPDDTIQTLKYNTNWLTQKTESLHERIQDEDIESLEPIQPQHQIKILGYKNGALLGLKNGQVIQIRDDKNG